jgi:hypothetical protein
MVAGLWRCRRVCPFLSNSEGRDMAAKKKAAKIAAGNKITTLIYGEEDPPVTTLAVGEEHPPITTMIFGEEGPHITTFALGEETTQIAGEGQPGHPTTKRLGEEGPSTLAYGEETVFTTMVVGEEHPIPKLPLPKPTKPLRIKKKK